MLAPTPSIWNVSADLPAGPEVRMRPGRRSISRRVALGLILPAFWGQAAWPQEDHAAPGIEQALEMQEMLQRRAIRTLQERADEVRRDDRRMMERREQERADERRRDAQRDDERRRAIEADERRAWERRR
jgi:hypothetical protein